MIYGKTFSDENVMISMYSPIGIGLSTITFVVSSFLSVGSDLAMHVLT